MNMLCVPGLAKGCKHCGEVFPLEGFYFSKTNKDRRVNICKKCHRKKGLAWAQKNPERCVELRRRKLERNPERVRAYGAKWQKNNPEKRNAAARRRYQRNLEKSRAYIAAQQRAHPARRRMNEAKRRASMGQAVPKWANRFFIEEIYDLAARRTKLLGKKYVVDHIVPLKSNIVCGLHCEGNLQVITDSQNCRKGNLRWPDMPT